MQEDNDNKPPYLYALATFAIIFVIYLITLSPTTAFWDTSEYIAAAKVLGIPHPPGNPLFTVMAHVWGMLPFGNYAYRINLFAALTSAAGAAFWFLVAERWLRNILPARGPRLAAAFAGIFASAMAWTVWNQSTVNEKVYTVSLLSISLIVWCMVRWADLPDGPRRNGLLILAAYIGALTSTNHMMGVLAIPIIALYVLWTEPKLALQPWVMLMAWVLLLGVSGILGDAITVLWHGGNFGNPVQALTYKGAVEGASGITALVRVGGLLGIVGLAGWGIAKDRNNPLLYVGVLAVIVGLTLNYVYLPIRAAQHPPINEGEPIGFFSQALSDVLNRLQYGKPPVSQRMSPFGAQLGMYWHYWTWQWARDIGALRGLATGLFSMLCAWGLGTLWVKDKKAGTAAAVMLFILTLLLIYYLNFRFMYTYPLGTPEEHEVRERDYFFVASFAFVGVLLAAGFAAAIRATAEWLGDRVDERRRWMAGTPVLALALIPLLGNRNSAPRNNETLAHDFAVDMLQSVEPYGILITAGDNDTFPLWFAQEVLGVRTDVTLANLSLMNTDWHLRQLQRRETPTFDPAGAPKLWQRSGDTNSVPLAGAPAPGQWVKPTGSVFDRTTGFLDSLAEVAPAPKDSIPLSTYWIKFGTANITKSDVAVLFLIKDNAGKRPIYFSWSDGGYPDGTLGLGDYLVTQGMVRKLMPRPVVPSGAVINSTMGFVDMAKSRTLLFEVYHPEAAAHDRKLGWFDPPSASILSLYEIVYNGFSQVLLQAGDSAHAAQAASIVQRIQKSIGGQ